MEDFDGGVAINWPIHGATHFKGLSIDLEGHCVIAPDELKFALQSEGHRQMIFCDLTILSLSKSCHRHLLKIHRLQVVLRYCKEGQALGSGLTICKAIPKVVEKIDVREKQAFADNTSSQEIFPRRLFD